MKNTQTPLMWRHGDVMIAAVTEVPERAKALPTAILAHGEVTGHSHRIEDPKTVEMYKMGDILYMKVLCDHTALIHEEHKRITIPRGLYRVWQQREYTPTAIVRVTD